MHAFLTKLFHDEEHEGHEVLYVTNGMIFLRDLRVLRGEHWVVARRSTLLFGVTPRPALKRRHSACH